MIPITLFNLLVVTDVLFIIYSVIDHRNRLYANIISAFIASILAGYLAVVINAGIVQQSDGTAIQDASLAIIPFGLI